MRKAKQAPIVFISYNRSDVVVARELQQSLEASGTRVWRDQTNVYGGERWPKTLGEAVAESRVIVLLWSAKSSESDFVELEWCTALALKKPILPILLDNTPLPASLTSMNGLSKDELAIKLQASIERLAGKKVTGNLNKRYSEVFATLESGSDDVSDLITKMQEKEARLSSRKFLAREFLRSLLLPVAASMLPTLAATAFVLDNPIQVDARLVVFSVLLIVPTLAGLAAALLIPGLWRKSGLLVVCVAWLGLLASYQNRILAGPVADINERSVVVIFDRRDAGDSQQAELIRTVESLPATLILNDSEVAVKPFIYSFDPDNDYVKDAILANPFIRAVVRVASPGPGQVHMRTEVPALMHWQRLSVKKVLTETGENTFGPYQQTNLVLDPHQGFMLRTSLTGTAMDFRPLGFEVFPALVSYQDNALALETVVGHRSIMTSSDRFNAKLNAALVMAYGDFLDLSLGLGNLDCEAIQPLEPVIREQGFEDLLMSSEICQGDAQLVKAYRTKENSSEATRLSDATRSWMNQSMAGRALAGLRNPWNLALAEIDADAGVQVAVELYETCGDTDLEPAFEAFSSNYSPNKLAQATGQCLENFIQSNDPVFQEANAWRIAERLGMAYAMGLIDSPLELLNVVGADREKYCDDLRYRFRTLILDRFLSSPQDAADFLQRARESGCMESEPAPRFLHVFDYLSRQDPDKLRASSQAITGSKRLDENAQTLLRGMLTALIVDHDSSAFYQSQLEKIMTAYNKAGWCNALQSASGLLTEFGIEESETLAAFICQESKESVLQPLNQGMEMLAKLPLASSPVLLQQLEVFSLLAKGMQDESSADADAGAPSQQLLKRLAAFEGSSAYLQKYFPEIDDDQMLIGIKLKQQSAEQKIESLTGLLRKGNKPSLIALLAEAYLEAGNPGAAKAQFHTLINFTDSELRKDYYTARFAALEDSEYCGTAGQQFLTEAEIQQTDEYMELLAKLGRVPYPQPAALILLAELDSMQSFGINAEFAAFAEAQYVEMPDSNIAALRKLAPGALLRQLMIQWEWENGLPAADKLRTILDEASVTADEGPINAAVALAADIRACRTQ